MLKYIRAGMGNVVRYIGRQINEIEKAHVEDAKERINRFEAVHGPLFPRLDIGSKELTEIIKSLYPKKT